MKCDLILVGGLGNQLYQYGAALKVMNEFNIRELHIYIGNMKYYNENWGFLLNEFIKFKETDKVTIIDKPVYFRCSKYARKFMFSAHQFGYINDLSFSVEPKCWIPRRGRLVLDDYFEKINARAEIDNIICSHIRQDFIGLRKNICAIVVRGGEFLRLGWSSVNDRSKYTKLVTELKSKVPEIEFEVISDDIDYSRSLLGDIVEISKFHEQNAYSNFKTISLAEYKIIPPSSFARWAAIVDPVGKEVYTVNTEIDT